MCNVYLLFLSFLRLNGILLHVYCHALFIHLSISGHLGCFHLLTIVNNAVIYTPMIIGVQIFVQVLAFIWEGSVPGSGITGSCATSVFKFLRNHYTVKML